MLARGGYSKKLEYRLGFWPVLPAKKKNCKRIWIQAVSVGELLSIQNVLISLIKDSRVEIVLSGTTSTGLKIAEQKYSKNILASGPFPLDWWPFSFLAWRRIKPDMVISVDSELWPEHMQQARKRNIPFCIINGRLSNRSYNRLKYAGLLRKLLIPDNLHVLASSEEQKKRWCNIGLNKNRVTSTGNLKIDAISIRPPKTEEKNNLKNEMGFPENSIILAGISTWPGEEKFLLDSIQKIRNDKIDARLLLIPRHAERRTEIIEEINSFNFSFHQRTSKSESTGENIVYLADTTGELLELIKAADIAFLGKTLPPRGEGQNPLEPISAGIPVVLGPKCTNFSEIVESLLSFSAAHQGCSINETKNLLFQILKDPEKRHDMHEAGIEWKIKQGSPSITTLGIIKEMLFGEERNPS